jgi:hypothetical protein
MSNRCFHAFLTPPWWVTMGYAPRHPFQSQRPAAFKPAVAPQPAPGEPSPVGEQPAPGEPSPVGEQPAPGEPSPVGEQPGPGEPSPVGEQPGPGEPSPVGEQPAPGEPSPVGEQPAPGEQPLAPGQGQVIAGAVWPAAAGASVEARRRSDDTIVANTTTDDMGNFSLSVPTNGMPFDVYLTLMKSGLVPSRVYVSRLPTSSTQIGNVPLVPWEMLASWYQAFGQQAQATQATVIVAVRDSALSTVQSDTVAVLQGNSAVGYLFDPSSLGVSTGGIWALNVPPGPTEVAASGAGTVFGRAQIIAPAGQIVWVLIFAD